MDAIDTRGRRLMWWGMTLFLLGLLTGLIEEHLANPRMGLSAHLEGLMNGTLLLAIGAIWPHLRASAYRRTVIYIAAVYGAVANWATTLFAAVVGTSSMTPLAGTGHRASPLLETAVTVGFVSVGIAMLVMALLVLWALRANAVEEG